jgi:hypothetical protein
MDRVYRRMLVSAAILAFGLACFGAASACPYSPGKVTRVTAAKGKSQTARDNARCICSGANGLVHMVWEDERHGNFEVYYAVARGDSILEIRRISNTRAESTYPCVACDSADVYILWQENTGDVYDIYYVHLRDGTEAARKAIIQTNLNSEAPVAAAGPDGALYVAWQEGPYKMTGIYYGKISGDSLVEKQPVCIEHPGAFRPDIACDGDGRILVAWFEGLDIKSRLWDGSAWGPETPVATTLGRAWRLSLASLSPGVWMLAWFDIMPDSQEVLTSISDGVAWREPVKISSTKIAYYPSLAPIGDGMVVAAWEEMVPGGYTIVLRCFDGNAWGRPLEVYSDPRPGRYASMAESEDGLHVVWFSSSTGDNEIYHCTLRRD